MGATVLNFAWPIHVWSSKKAEVMASVTRT